MYVYKGGREYHGVGRWRALCVYGYVCVCCDEVMVVLGERQEAEEREDRVRGGA